MARGPINQPIIFAYYDNPKISVSVVSRTLLHTGRLPSAHDVPVPDTERETTLTLRLSPEAMTRSGDGTVQESAVHDLSLYFFHKTTPEASERLYLKNPGSRVSLSLPTGDYELFALANTGGDPGELTAERLAAYTLPLCNDEELVRQGIAMSARQSVRVEGATEIPCGWSDASLGSI